MSLPASSTIIDLEVFAQPRPVRQRCHQSLSAYPLPRYERRLLIAGLCRSILPHYGGTPVCRRLLIGARVELFEGNTRNVCTSISKVGTSNFTHVAQASKRHWRGTESAAHLIALCGYPLANRKQRKQIKQPVSGNAMTAQSWPWYRNATTNILPYVIFWASQSSGYFA